MPDTETHPTSGGTVHVPGFGAVKKKTATYAAVGVGVVVVLVLVVRRRQSATAAAAAPTDQATTTPTDQAGVLPGDQGGGVQVGPGVTTDLAGGIPGAVGPGSFSNNAQWAQYAEAGMGSNGADSIAAALGKYITGGEVTAAQVTTIDEAIAIAGYPPVNGPGGRPPSINQTGGPHPPPPQGKVTVPRVIGDRVENANSALSALGLRSTLSMSRKPGLPYHVTSQSPSAGTKVNKGATVHLTIKEGA